MGLKGSLESRSLTQHESDAIIAGMTGYLYINGQTESVGDPEEGYVIMPKRQDWRKLKI
jgi:predicted nuclease with RNAse H fold